METRRRRWIWTGAGVVFLAGVTVWVVRPDPVAVETAAVERGSLAVTVEEEGRTRVRERYTVAAPVAGRLRRPPVDEGERIGRGAVLATLVPAPEDPRTRAILQADLEAARARLEEARAARAEAAEQSRQAEREVARRRSLLEQGIVARETVEQAELAAASARARRDSAGSTVEAARAGVEQVRARLEGTEPDVDGGPQAGGGADEVPVRAPTAGTVLRVLEESERVVAAGTPLIEIGDPGGLEIVVDLLTEEAVRVEPGDPMRITGWGGDRTLAGRVRLVEPDAFTKISALGVEEQRVNVIGDFVDPPAALGSGFRVDVAVVTWQDDDVLTVPTSALFRRGEGWQVFAVESGRARLRAVEIGHRGVERAEVLGGLSAGEEVVVYPSDQVTDGVRVEPEG